MAEAGSSPIRIGSSCVRLLLNPTAARTVVHVNASLLPQFALAHFPVLLAALIRGYQVIIQLHGGRWANVALSSPGRFVWTFVLRRVARIVVFQVLFGKNWPVKDTWSE